MKVSPDGVQEKKRYVVFVTVDQYQRRVLERPATEQTSYGRVKQTASTPISKASHEALPAIPKMVPLGWLGKSQGLTIVSGVHP